MPWSCFEFLVPRANIYDKSQVTTDGRTKLRILETGDRGALRVIYVSGIRVNITPAKNKVLGLPMKSSKYGLKS